ncbi:virB8 family protein [Brucella intermedia]|uniref:virB8 family protein n=1 Tax=Brucella intermedia TaxID=94625 RepID=UPI00235ED853|nr:type IV secretion system protein [Brucella intermedia]
MAKIGAALEEELIFGAMDRERRWRRIAYVGLTFGIIGCLTTGAVAIFVDKPAPELVPYDVRNGVVLPDTKITSISTKQTDAIIESLVYAYVQDRESYNFFDNDLRIESVRQRSTGAALESLRALWDNQNPDSLPRQYANKSRIDVAISSINLLSDNRAQVQIRKRLTAVDGSSDGAFLVTLEYQLTPARRDSLEAVWKNPFGFIVTNYRVAPQQYQQNDGGAH